MPRYGRAAQESVHRAMHRMKKGKLESGGNHRKVKSRAQAVAIGLSEAREKGAKVPPQHASTRSRSRGHSSSKRRSSSTSRRKR